MKEEKIIEGRPHVKTGIKTTSPGGELEIRVAPPVFGEEEVGLISEIPEKPGEYVGIWVFRSDAEKLLEKLREVLEKIR